MSNDKGAASADWLSAPVGGTSTENAPESGSAATAAPTRESSTTSRDSSVDTPVSTKGATASDSDSALARYKSSFTNRLASSEPKTGSVYPDSSPPAEAAPDSSPGPATSVGLGSATTSTSAATSTSAGTSTTSTGVRTISAKNRRGGRGPRRAKLQIRHIDPWSTLKLSLVIAVAFFFVWMIAVAILYGVLSGMGVFEAVDGMFSELDGQSTTIVTPKVVFGGAALIGAINIVLFTALATIGAYIYNLCADLAGGLEITLAERG